MHSSSTTAPGAASCTAFLAVRSSWPCPRVLVGSGHTGREADGQGTGTVCAKQLAQTTSNQVGPTGGLALRLQGRARPQLCLLRGSCDSKCKRQTHPPVSVGTILHDVAAQGAMQRQPRFPRIHTAPAISLHTRTPHSRCHWSPYLRLSMIDDFAVRACTWNVFVELKKSDTSASLAFKMAPAASRAFVDAARRRIRMPGRAALPVPVPLLPAPCASCPSAVLPPAVCPAADGGEHSRQAGGAQKASPPTRASRTCWPTHSSSCGPEAHTPRYRRGRGTRLTG